MPAEERRRRARSFAGVACEHDRGRPGYPPEAIEWALGTAAVDVLDIGAGPGKLAEAVLAAGHRVIAVEPLAEMRAVLEVRAPAARVIDATGRTPATTKGRARTPAAPTGKEMTRTRTKEIKRAPAARPLWRPRHPCARQSSTEGRRVRLPCPRFESGSRHRAMSSRAI
jgi:SAM-dependent methyltransferase